MIRRLFARCVIIATVSALTWLVVSAWGGQANATNCARKHLPAHCHAATTTVAPTSTPSTAPLAIPAPSGSNATTSAPVISPSVAGARVLPATGINSAAIGLIAFTVIVCGLLVWYVGRMRES